MITNGIVIGICETQPLMVEGLRATLGAGEVFQVLQPVRTLESLTRLVIASGPRLVIIDKACGTPAVLDWLSRNRNHLAVAAVVWGNAISDAEALRFLKAGARGVIRKTADLPALLSCLDAVANGATWMEDALFQQACRADTWSRPDLTQREQQVLELVEQGLRNKEIASELGIRPGTVKIHLRHIFEKTGVHGRYGLALSGLRERGEMDRLSA